MTDIEKRLSLIEATQKQMLEKQDRLLLLVEQLSNRTGAQGGLTARQEVSIREEAAKIHEQIMNKSRRKQR